MGIELSGPDEGPVPRPVFLSLTCDGEHGHSAPSVFTGDGNGYVSQRKVATEQGWRFAGNGKVYGPCCQTVGTKLYEDVRAP